MREAQKAGRAVSGSVVPSAADSPENISLPSIPASRAMLHRAAGIVFVMTTVMLIGMMAVLIMLVRGSVFRRAWR